MAEQREYKPTVLNRERIVSILDELKPKINAAVRLVGVIKKYQQLLSEPSLLLSYRKDWIALSIAYKLYNLYKSGTFNADQVRNYIKHIRAYDESLAAEVSKLLPITQGEVNIFSDLIRTYAQGTEKDKRYFVSYIVTYVRELLTKAKSIKDEKKSRKLVQLLSSISGHETEFLMRYRNDCDNWSNVRYAVNYQIDFFIRRLNLYLRGGFEDNIKFMGLYKDFGDTELTNVMLSNDAIKRLWRHNEQLNYLKVLIGLCKKSEASGKWEGFFGKDGVEGKRGFWTDFNNYRREFEVKYGNITFAETLKAKKNKIGESPAGWGGEWVNERLVKDGLLPQLLRTLQDPQTQRTEIIIPASLEIQKIMKGREDKLTGEREKSIKELIEMIWDLSGVGVNREKIIKKFRRLLEKKKWQLAKKAESEANELIMEATTPLLAYDEFTNRQRIAMTKIDLEFMENRMKRLALVAESNSKYLNIKLRTDESLRSLGSLALVDGANGSIVEASQEIIRMMRYDHLTEVDFQAIEKLAPQAAGVIRGLVNFINSYLKQKISNKYVITIDDIEKLPINIEQKKSKSVKPEPKDMKNAA